MSMDCPEYPKCADRRVADAEFRGKVLATLDVIQKDVTETKSAVWGAIDNTRGDVKGIYYKVGGIAAGTSVLLTILGKVIFR